MKNKVTKFVVVILMVFSSVQVYGSSFDEEQKQGVSVEKKGEKKAHGIACKPYHST